MPLAESADRTAEVEELATGAEVVAAETEASIVPAEDSSAPHWDTERTAADPAPAETAPAKLEPVAD